eukprot:Hpha_TRINITY_DN15959_c1_g2::TRINITY_DN15959_c1_g2_i1::g.70584::m.70584
MDPGWFCLYLFLAFETLVVLLLVAPVPHNKVRGLILKTVHALLSNKHVRIAMGFFLLLDLYYFWDCMDFLLGNDKHEHGHHGPSATAYKLRKQRNSYITAFGLIMFLVIMRLLDLLSKLYEMREEKKKAAAGQPVSDKKLD